VNEQFLYNRPQFPAQINWSHPSTKGLVGCWLFNENGGMQAWDSASSPNHLTLQGFTTNRRSSSGLLFAGAQYCSKVVADYRSADSQGYIEVWFRTTTTASSQIFVSSSDNNTTTSFLQTRINATTGALSISTRNAAGTANQVSGTTNAGDRELHQAVFSSNGTVWSIFRDSQPESLSVTAGSNTGDWFADVTLRDNVNVGAFVASITSFYNTGEIGLVRIGSREMLQPEARSLYLDPYAMFLK